ncbi:hypothetical protein ACU4HD_27100 [Cupriavidus basilensis]
MPACSASLDANARAGPLAGIVEQVAEDLDQVLAVAGKVPAAFHFDDDLAPAVQAGKRARQLGRRRTGLDTSTASTGRTGRARARQVAIHLPAHGFDLRGGGAGRVAGQAPGFVGKDGKRCP